MLLITSIIRIAQSKSVSGQIDDDSFDRILACLQVVGNTDVGKPEYEIFLSDTKRAYNRMLAVKELKEQEAHDVTYIANEVHDQLQFRQFCAKPADDLLPPDAFDQATQSNQTFGTTASSLRHIVQLTGFSDAVYAEVDVRVNGFDILLNVLLVNQTSDTLQNLCVDFSTLGDLKQLERPSVYAIEPHGFQKIRTTIKVSSTETGVIFGNILWEGPGLSEACVVLNDVHIDIMDYIKPSHCTFSQFRTMWTEFEWENRVNVNSALIDLRTYLKYIMRATNMACVTPDAAISDDCKFLSVNLYARSVFGEDALANLSIEKLDTGVINGHVRIRSKMQGIALALGDRITLAQKRQDKTSIELCQ